MGTIEQELQHYKESAEALFNAARALLCHHRVIKAMRGESSIVVTDTLLNLLEQLEGVAPNPYRETPDKMGCLAPNMELAKEIVPREL